MARIIRAEHSGFCFGVKRAIKLAREAASRGGGPVYSLGHIIHNRQEVERLEKAGIKVVEDIAEADSGTLIIRSHGAHPSIEAGARAKGLKVVDATCPFVKRLHRIVEHLNGEGYRTVVAGERDHPEVMALPGVEIVQNAGEALKISRSKKIGLLSQTTLSADNFREIASVLIVRAEELRVFNTICSATGKRQASAAKLSGKVDLMIVVGGYDSGNTRRLKDICEASGTRTIHVETAAELDMRLAGKAGTIGVTAGASTPDWIVKEVIGKLEEAA